MSDNNTMDETKDSADSTDTEVFAIGPDGTSPSDADDFDRYDADNDDDDYDDLPETPADDSDGDDADEPAQDDSDELDSYDADAEKAGTSFSFGNPKANGADQHDADRNDMDSEIHDQFSTAFDAIDELIQEISEAPSTFLSTRFAKVDRESLLDQLDDLKTELPVQLEHASTLMREASHRLHDAQTEANSIISDAKAKAAKIISTAEDRADFLVGQEHVVAMANARAQNIVNDAQAEADKITIGADNYCSQVMTELSNQLQHLSASVNAGITAIQQREADARESLVNIPSEIDERRA